MSAIPIWTINARGLHALFRVLCGEIHRGELRLREAGTEDEVLATQGTPLAGTTLLHMCVDYDEFEIAQWLLAHGADVNTRAAIDASSPQPLDQVTFEGGRHHSTLA